MKRDRLYNGSLNRSCKEDGTKKEEGRNEWGGGHRLKSCGKRWEIRIESIWLFRTRHCVAGHVILHLCAKLCNVLLLTDDLLPAVASLKFHRSFRKGRRWGARKSGFTILDNRTEIYRGASTATGNKNDLYTG